MLNKLVNSLKKESPIIFATAAFCGIIATVVSSVKAGEKIAELDIDENDQVGTALAYAEVLAEPVAIATATGVSLAASVMLSKRQYAILSAGYLLLENQYKEYRDAVIDCIGLDEEKKIRDAISEKKLLTEHPIPDDDEVLFYDELSRRYFTDTPLHVLNTELQFNYEYATKGQIEWNHFYELLDHEEMPPLEKFVGEGWDINYDIMWNRGGFIEFENTTAVLDDGMECIIIRVPWGPCMNYEWLP